jgi:hypothetical protein
VKWPSNLRGEILTRSLKNVKLYSGCKVGEHDKTWTPHTRRVTCVRLLTGWVNGSRQNVFYHSHGLNKTKRLVIHPTVTLFNKHNRDRIQIHTLSEISRFSIYNEACATKWELPEPQPLKYLSAMTSLILIKHGQQKVENFDCDQTFQASWASFQPHLLMQRDLTTLSVIWICLKKQAEV